MASIANEEYSSYKARKYQENQRRVELARQAERERSQAERERVCDRVTVRISNYIALEYRAKPGVSRTEGYRVCGKSAFNQGSRVWYVSEPSIALGGNIEVDMKRK